MGEIENNIASIKKTLGEHVTLVAVSKTKPVGLILEAYNTGHRVFGENKVQELIQKEAILPKDIKWHLIGHLQSNKVKYIAPFVMLIHSVDSLNLLTAIDVEAKKNNRIIDCLLQAKIAKEETKFGLSFAEIENILQSPFYKSLKHIRIIGLMGMATFTDNLDQVREEFKMLKHFFTQIKTKYFSAISSFKEISMGMSDDYLIAQEEGATIIRVGSKIFGDRLYTKIPVQ